MYIVTFETMCVSLIGLKRIVGRRSKSDPLITDGSGGPLRDDSGGCFRSSIQVFVPRRIAIILLDNNKTVCGAGR